MQTTKRMKKQEWYHQQASASLSEPQQALASLREQTSESNQNFPSTRSFLTKEKHNSFWLYFLAIFIFLLLPSFFILAFFHFPWFFIPCMVDYYKVEALSHWYVGAADEAHLMMKRLQVCILKYLVFSSTFPSFPISYLCVPKQIIEGVSIQVIYV